MNTQQKIVTLLFSFGAAMTIVGLYDLSINKRMVAMEQRIAAIKTSMALVESNSVETVQAARNVHADLGKLAEAVLRWRMSLPTNLWTTNITFRQASQGNYVPRWATEGTLTNNAAKP
jgi:hypothetical protein